MPTLTLEPAPFGNKLVTQTGTMSSPWERYFLLALLPRVEQAAPNLVATQLTAQSASIGTTALIALATGLYRINWFFRRTTAATTSSSFTLNLHATDGGISVTQSGATNTTNTTASIQSGSMLMLCDAGTPLSYSVTYASVGLTAMVFKLTIAVEGIL